MEQAKSSRARHGGRWLRVVAGAALALAVWPYVGAAADDGRLAIFDTHVHYSRDAWNDFDATRIFAILDAAGVDQALVSSSPDEGTLVLHRHDRRRAVPELRPYHGEFHPGNWHAAPQIVGYLEARLKTGIYRGIGEFHLHTEDDARTPTVRRVAALAVAHDIPLHVHAGAGPVEALFALEPDVKILWAHAGFVEPPSVVGDMLDRHTRLWTELSFRAHDIAPGGRLDADWRDLFARHGDRFMIGSDTYINERWAAYGSLIEAHRRWLDQLPRETAKAIAHANAMRVFAPQTPSP